MCDPYDYYFLFILQFFVNGNFLTKGVLPVPAVLMSQVLLVSVIRTDIYASDKDYATPFTLLQTWRPVLGGFLCRHRAGADNYLNKLILTYLAYIVYIYLSIYLSNISMHTLS